MKLTIEDLNIFCKRKGFIYPTAEIYGGLAGFFDYGHLGIELKNNIKQEWWRFHVHSREDIVGIDGSIITNPKVWQASGHLDSFTDFVTICKKCGRKYKADTLIKDELNIKMDVISKKEINNLINKHKIFCPRCNGMLSEVSPFNLMFKTNIGPIESAVAYLRPETAQLIFINFKSVLNNARLKLPFGIAQIGKAFRNEISPRDFLFRCREFEQMEIEYFIHPEKFNECPYIKEVLNYKINVYDASMQKNSKKMKKMTVKEIINKNIMNIWHAYWIAVEHKWFSYLGVNPDHLRARQHLPEELSHYAVDTWDLEYKFPFGWKEILGIANRADYDLKQHMHSSKTDLTVYDEEKKKKILPYVIEPSLGVDRSFLVFLFEAYNYDKSRKNVVLKLHPKLAPIKVGVFPLVNKLDKGAREVYKGLMDYFSCTYDKSGSIGRRYARADEIGIPFCITYDFDSLKDNAVTIRDRDTTKQLRVKISKLRTILNKLILEDVKFENVK